MDEQALFKTKTKLRDNPCIPHRFFFSISEKHCTKFKPLFPSESTYFHCFPVFYLSLENLNVKLERAKVSRPSLNSYQGKCSAGQREIKRKAAGLQYVKWTYLLCMYVCMYIHTCICTWVGIWDGNERGRGGGGMITQSTTACQNPIGMPYSQAKSSHNLDIHYLM